MLLEAEDGAIIDANAFKDAVAVQKSVVEHRNPCVLCGHKLPIDIHLHDVSLLAKNGYNTHDPCAHGIVAEIRSAVRIRAGSSVGYCNAGAPCAKGSCRCGCGIRLRGTATAKAATSSCPRFHTGTARQQISGLQVSRLAAKPCCAIALSSWRRPVRTLSVGMTLSGSSTVASSASRWATGQNANQIWPRAVWRNGKVVPSSGEMRSTWLCSTFSTINTLSSHSTPRKMVSPTSCASASI